MIRTSLPDLRLILVEEKTHVLIEKLRVGDLDAAFLALPVEEDGLEGAELFEDPFVVAVPAQHPMSQRNTIPQSHLRDAELLLLEEGHCLREIPLRMSCGRSQRIPDFRATSLETLQQVVKAEWNHPVSHHCHGKRRCGDPLHSFRGARPLPNHRIVLAEDHHTDDSDEHIGGDLSGTRSSGLNNSSRFFVSIGKNRNLSNGEEGQREDAW